MIRNSLINISAIIAMAISVSACSGTRQYVEIRARLVDPATKAPIAGEIIFLAEARNGYGRYPFSGNMRIVKTSRTDAEGKVEFSDLFCFPAQIFGQNVLEYDIPESISPVVVELSMRDPNDRWPPMDDPIESGDAARKEQRIIDRGGLKNIPCSEP